MAEEATTLGTDWTQDGKLSTAQRKKLSGGTFCGPNRSFPIPDCAHVIAGRRLLGRYKGPGSKAKILACINRKGKSLGCSNKSKDQLSDAEIEKLINSEAFDSARELMAFLEAVYIDMTPEEKHLDEVKQSACVLLNKLRSRRNSTEPKDEQFNTYMARSMTSVLDALQDEVDILDEQTETTDKE